MLREPAPDTSSAAAEELAEKWRRFAATQERRHRHDDAVWAELAGTGAGARGAAHRGDLIVLRDLPVYGVALNPADHFTVGVITGLTRDGAPRFYKTAGSTRESAKGTDLSTKKADRIWVLSADIIDVPGALASAACCPNWTGHFDSMDAVATALRPHLKDGRSSSWKALSEAAGEWEKARRQADEQSGARFSAATTRDARHQAWEMHRAAVGAAHDAYRRTRSQVIKDSVPPDTWASQETTGSRPAGEFIGDTTYRAAQAALDTYRVVAARSVHAVETLEATLTVHGFDRDPALMEHISGLRETTRRLAIDVCAARAGLTAGHALGDEYHSSGRDAASSAFRPDGT